jgi:hypothetical protein
VLREAGQSIIWAAHVQKGAWRIAPSRSRSRAPLAPRCCETGTACPCTCTRWRPTPGAVGVVGLILSLALRSSAQTATLDWSTMSRGRRHAARFTFAHLARCAAAIRLRPAAEIVRFGLAALCFVHRVFCARLIFRAAADMV